MFYRSLVTYGDLRIQYPNAVNLIDHLPGSNGRCFKPEAQLLIEKFLSLKNFANSLMFIFHVKQDTDAKCQFEVC